MLINNVHSLIRYLGGPHVGHTVIRRKSWRRYLQVSTNLLSRKSTAYWHGVHQLSVSHILQHKTIEPFGSMETINRLPQTATSWFLRSTFGPTQVYLDCMQFGGEFHTDFCTITPYLFVFKHHFFVHNIKPGIWLVRIVMPKPYSMQPMRPMLNV